MSQRYSIWLITIIMLLAMALGLMSCRPAAPTPQPAAAQPTSAAAPTTQPTAAPQTEGTEPVLTVGGKALTMVDLQALEQISTDVEGQSYQGVRFLDVLKAGGITSGNLLMVAGDGYSAAIDVSALTAESLLAYNAKGGVDVVLPGMGHGQWVRELVELQAGAGSEEKKDVAAKPTAAQPAGPSAVGGPVELTDAAGQTLKLDKLPQRIVVVGRGPYMSLHLLYMFPQARERLVGLEQKGAGSVSNFLPLIDPGFGSKTIIAQNPGPEQVAALKPDLVIMKGNMVDKLGQTLAQVGIPTLYVWLEGPEAFLKDVANFGAILGNPERAQEIIAYYQTRMDRLAKGTAGIAESDKPRVLLLEYSDRGGKVAVQVPAKSWIQTIEVQTAGGAPVWLENAEPTDGWTVVNFEQIAAWDPDQIYLVVWYTLDPAKVIADLKADAGWSTLKAVKDNQLYAFPQDLFGWDSPEPRWILGMQWLATRLYPDRFADLNMIDELYQFFGQLYGMDKAAVDAGIMPKAKIDVH